MTTIESFKKLGISPTSNIEAIKGTYSIIKKAFPVISKPQIVEYNEAYFKCVEYARNQLRFVHEAIYLSFENE